ncbi:protoporphyrinogen oxidase HemJ [Roseibium polysiphoniae]|uniref:Protoporphyrinogen IX oxidase n=1 Tax=Roseibium polysiphoniae TaxID=2571221 RepID=A0A944CEL8_9HYPH|nr:protoporphyrinogen oxidase HemJ [Roseibium polysiphoniae]MBS8261720.1 protoporphyrinogen oxidase HemJ [Roseibium polysiphoniae]
MGVYEWVKSIHVISIIAWMAGMLYLPRLFVYHVDAEVGSDKSETFKVMERRLLKAIINPAMISAWIFGLWAAYEVGAFSQGWFHAKLTLVILMSAAHGYLSGCVKRFARDENKKSAKFYRILNEVPTVLMIFIVILVIGKPF